MLDPATLAAVANADSNKTTPLKYAYLAAKTYYYGDNSSGAQPAATQTITVKQFVKFVAAVKSGALSFNLTGGDETLTKDYSGLLDGAASNLQLSDAKRKEIIQLLRDRTDSNSSKWQDAFQNDTTSGRGYQSRIATVYNVLTATAASGNGMSSLYSYIQDIAGKADAAADATETNTYMRTAVGNYATGFNAMATAAQSNYSLRSKQKDLVNAQKYAQGGFQKDSTGANTATVNPYLVYSVSDFINAIAKLNTKSDTNVITGNKHATTSTGVPDSANNSTSFTSVFQTDGTFSISNFSSSVVTSANQSSFVKGLFTPTGLTTAPTSTKDPYHTASWAETGDTPTNKNYKLTELAFTGDGGQQIAQVADSSRQVQFTSFKTMSSTIDQMIADAQVGNVNILTGSAISVATNDKDGKLEFQFKNDDGTAASFNSLGLGINVNATSITSATTGENKFETNVGIDAGLEQIKTSQAKVKELRGILAVKAEQLKTFSDYNKSVSEILSGHAKGLNSVNILEVKARILDIQNQMQSAMSGISGKYQIEQMFMKIGG